MELETCQGLRSNRLRLGLYRLEATQRFVVRVQEVFPCTLPRGERGCGQRPRCWQDPWGSRSRGQCAVGTHFKGFGVKGARAPPYKAQWNLAEIALCSLAWLSGDRWAHVASVAKAAPCALRPLSLDNLQVLVQSLLWPLAEPFQPKLGLSLYERLMPIFTPSRIIPN